ncbi:hypothetical protein SAMN04487949_1882 [Halogranum gelatinilyticum]|uniref:Envelope protein N-terminal domain-containing protein n=1 Tax=Halogranum gelatinilyticum TaxID=660521 RepID=A0A1G9TRS8_9EURY|nr:hypothetical protein [Halogranum gelatinilyticum]SDM50362.1 hypothetical protein SAMN04487949_1882 [Halogranum gelatinilyticum]
MLRKIARLTLAFVIVSSAVLGGVGGGIGQAEAQTSISVEQCDLSRGVVNPLWLLYDMADLKNECGFFTADSDATSNIDFYQSSQAIGSQTDSYMTTSNNLANDIEPVLMCKAKARVIEGLNDGNTSAVVKSEANVTVRDYTTRQQINSLENWNAAMYSLEYQWSQNNSSLYTKEHSTEPTAPIVGWATTNVSLNNGTQHKWRLPVYDIGTQQRVWEPRDQADDGTGTPNVYNVSGTAPTDSYHVYQDGGVYQGGASQDLTEFEIVDITDYYNLLDQSASQSQRVQDNVNALVDGVYGSYQSGDLNATALNDACTLAHEGGTNSSSTGYYGYAAAELAKYGLSSNFNSSFSVTSNGTTYNGTLFYSGEDVSSFEANQTYDPANLSGTTYMAVQDGNASRVVQLDESWQVNEITNPKTGETQQNTTVQKYVYETYDTNRLQQEIERALEIREQVEAAENEGGGGFGINIGGTQFATLGVVVALLVVALFRP